MQRPASASADWIGLLRHTNGTLSGWRFAARSCTARAAAPDLDALLEALGAARGAPAILVDDGAHDLAPLPCAILPDPAGLAQNAALGALQQDSPAAILPPSVRLQIAGFLALNPEWDGVVVALCDGRSHWVHLSAGEAVSMSSFLTPMLAANLGAPLGGEAPDLQALTRSQSRPEALAAHLSSADLTGNGGAIAGHLLGAELSASKPYWLGQNLALIAPKEAASAYRAALAAQGLSVTQTDPDAMAQNGFVALRELLGG